MKQNGSRVTMRDILFRFSREWPIRLEAVFHTSMSGFNLSKLFQVSGDKGGEMITGKHAKGNALAEYGVIACLVALVCAVPLTNFGNDMADSYAGLNGFLGEGVNTGNSVALTQAGSPSGAEALFSPGAGETTVPSSPGSLSSLNTAQVASMIEVGGAEGTVTDLAVRLEQMAQTMNAENNPEQANILKELAHAGRDISAEITQMKALIVESQDHDPDQHLSPGETMYLDELPDPNVLQAKIERFNQMKAKSLQSLVSVAPGYVQEVNALSGHVVNISDGFKQEVVAIRQPVEQGLADATLRPYMADLINNRNERYNNLNQSIADYVVRQDSNQIEATGAEISSGGLASPSP